MGNTHSNRRSSRERRSQPKVDLIQAQPTDFTSLDQVTSALRKNGLESCNLILGIDFTKSNEWSGKRTFNGRSLHTINDPTIRSNPYEEVIEIIGKTLRDFDEDNIIPMYGFGDDRTEDHSIFTFADDGVDNGFPFECLRQRYKEVVPHVCMAGPTSFGPIISHATNIVRRTGEYHILLIIADGQVTRSVDVPARAVSKNEKETIDAIAYASHFPLSIIMVGVGDGPWDSMVYFDKYLVNRKFDNFRFVEYHKICNMYPDPTQKETNFALQALLEIPQQYLTIKRMSYLSAGKFGLKAPGEPPCTVVYPKPRLAVSPGFSQYQQEGLVYEDHQYLAQLQEALTMTAADGAPVQQPSADAPALDETFWHSGAPSARNSHLLYRGDSQAEIELNQLQEALLCCICEDRRKDTVFSCGHETCAECSEKLSTCPTCRAEITVRIKRFV